MKISRRSLARWCSSVATGVALLLIAPPADALTCPGVTPGDSTAVYINSTQTGAPGTIYAFVGAGCATAKFGTMQPALCQAHRGMFTGATVYFTAGFRAMWSSGAQTGTTMNGCTFICPGGTCQVRGVDGLPVELLSFGVD